MKEVQSLFLIFLVFPLIACHTVNITGGTIEGIQSHSRKNEPFWAFRGIPYAEPPVGNLRFQPPVKKSPWLGVLNTINYPSACMQVGQFSGFTISEDCLYLNVYSKNVGSSNLKPVLVYIHGGAFQSGASFQHGPEYFMDRDLVLVTINYRLGAFGFLASGTNKAMGNMGLKDQVMALEWVRDNIQTFGGDPQQVTISGLSAGGFSVTSLMASDMSRGLFNRAIVVSGSITWMSRMRNDYKEIVDHLGKELNCTLAQDVVECLQAVPADRLARVDVTPATGCGSRAAMLWNPVIEGDFNQTKFFSKNPLEVFRDNSSLFSNMQVMIGITEHETVYTVPVILSDPQYLTRIETDFNKLLYECFYTAVLPRNTDVFRKTYLPFEKIDDRSFDGLGKLGSDGVIGYGSHRLVRWLSNVTDVYYYKFSYAGQLSWFNYPRNSPYGVTHGDDIQYVFPTRYIGEMIQESHRDNFMVESLTRIWEQFVWRGNPNNNSDQYLQDMVWPKYDWNDEYYLDIGTHMVEKQALLNARYNLWDNLSSGSSSIKYFNFLGIIFISSLLKLFM